MRLILLLLLPAICTAQSFSTLEGQIFNTKGNIKPAFGVTFTGGGFLKGKNNDRSLQLGAGVSANFFNSDDLYFAPFAQMGYFNSKAKITPYANARIGYGFYKGNGAFMNVHSNKGGLFTDVRAGAGFKVYRSLRITPYIGCTAIILRYVVNKETIESSFVGILSGGVALVFTK